MTFSGVAAVFRFEMQRSMTVWRMAWWAMLVLFPPSIVFIQKAFGAPTDNSDFMAMMLQVLIPGIVCMLGQLLWATPLLQGEIEGGTWVFLAVRPSGKLNVLLGKYFAAVTWTALAGLAGLTLAVLISGTDKAVHVWTALVTLILLASMAYGALFAFLGILAPKRGMVIAFGYALIVEFIVGTIPAMINQFTVQFRLRTLLRDWIDWTNPQIPQGLSLVTGTGPAWQHVVILFGFTAGLITAAAYLVLNRELVAGGDS